MSQPVSSSRVHAGTWAEGASKRNMEERAYSLRMDTITNKRLVDPMSPKCGHTYNRETWFSLDKYVDPVTKAVYEDSVKCPDCRARVPLDSLGPNLYAKSAVEYLKEHHRMSSSSSSSSTTASTMAPTVETAPIVPAAPVAPTPAPTPLAQQDPGTARILAKLEDIEITLNKIAIKSILQHREITNFVKMTYCDRAWSLINCSHIETVAKRGFTDEQWKTLHTPLVVNIGGKCQTLE